MATIEQLPEARRTARLRAWARGRTGILTGLLVVIVVAWALTIVTSVVAPDAQGRLATALSALGGHGHEVAGAFDDGSVSLPLALVLVAGSWIVMTAAMMLPSSVPMITVLAASSSRTTGWRRQFASFMLGYFVVWVAFGLVAFAFDLGLRTLGDAWPWLGENWQVVTAAALAIGAVYQLTPLKDACLKGCRHPVSFLLRHHRRRGGVGWDLGLRHGMFCVGCCWALMLVMVVAGTAQLALMGVLALVMLAEKAMPWGEKVVRPIGIVFAVAAVVVLFVGSGGHVHGA